MKGGTVRQVHWVLILVLGLSGFLLQGCEGAVEYVSLRIPGFDTSQVTGVSLWKLDEATGKYRKHDELAFDRETIDGQEWVSYSVRGDSVAGPAASWRSRVERPDSESDSVKLDLLVPRPAAGTYKLSLSNEAGDSGLSRDALRVDAA